MQTELVGKTLGNYKVLEKLDRGGMATVYKGLDPANKRAVAIKVLPAYFAHDPQYIRRFRREAKAARVLDHPHIVRVYDDGDAYDISYIVMEYISGGTLKALLLREGVTLRRAALLVGQIADALSYAHAAGIVHRDVKPSNVLMAGPDFTKLSDFGIAKISSDETALTALTATGVGVGTAAYMAPEQAMEAASADHRADIYSLGVMIYEMIAGCLPYNADTPMGLLAQHIYEPIPPLRRDAPQASMTIEHILFKALAKDPDQRFDSAIDLAAAFSDAVAHKPVAIELPESAPRQALTEEPTEAVGLHPPPSVPDYEDEIENEPETVIVRDAADQTASDITGLLSHMKDQHRAIFTRALRAFDANDMETARRLVLRILNDDDHVAEAWLLRSYIEENWYDQNQCALNALAVAPDSEDARLRVEQLKGVRLPVTYGQTKSLIPAVREVHDAVMDEYFQASKLEEAVDPLDNPNQCPYCGTVNEPSRTVCTACKKSLMRTRTPRRQTSDSLNMAIMLNVASIVMVVLQLLPPLIWTWYKQIQAGSLLQSTMNIIFEQTVMILLAGDFTSILTAQLFAFLVVAGIIRGAMILLAGIGLRFRANWGYYFGLFMFALEIIWALVATIMKWTGIGVGGLSAIIAIAGLMALSAATSNFHVTTERYLVRPDGRLKSGHAYWQRGIEYQREGMWALAVVHFRAAVAAAPNVQRHYKSLGIGYNKLGRLDRALSTLEQALRLDPMDPETTKMLERVRQLLAEADQNARSRAAVSRE